MIAIVPEIDDLVSKMKLCWQYCINHELILPYVKGISQHTLIFVEDLRSREPTALGMVFFCGLVWWISFKGFSGDAYEFSLP